MNKKLLIGIIVVIVVFVIAAAILGNPFFAYPLATWIPLVVWIYLVFVIRKKKTNLFRDQMEPKLAERRYKMLKAFLLVAGISLAAFIVDLVLKSAIGGPSEEGPVVFYIALFSVVLFYIGTIGGLVIFLKGRRKTR